MKKYFKQKLLILLIIIAPIPAAITWNWFYPARVLLLFSLYSIVNGIGLYHIFTFLIKKPKAVFIVSTIFISFLIANNLSNLSTSLLLYLPYQERGNWQYGMREVATEISKHEG